MLLSSFTYFTLRGLSAALPPEQDAQAVPHAWPMPSCMLLLSSGLGTMKMRASWNRIVTCTVMRSITKQVVHCQQSAAPSQLRPARVAWAAQDRMMPLALRTVV